MLDKENRNKFVEAAGVRYAAFGGMSFGVYKSCEEAFEAFRTFLPYKQLQFNKQADYSAFEKGYQEFQKYRVQYQLIQREADAVMKEILASIDYNAPNYIYENKEPE